MLNLAAFAFVGLLGGTAIGVVLRSGAPYRGCGCAACQGVASPLRPCIGTVPAVGRPTLTIVR